MFDAPTSPPDRPLRFGSPAVGASNTPRSNTPRSNTVRSNTLPSNDLPPIAPPADPRVGFSTAGVARPRPGSAPPSEPVSGPPSFDRHPPQEPAAPVRRGRFLLAFVAGAAVAAGSFGLGAVLTDDDAEPQEIVAVTQPVADPRSETSEGATIPVPTAPVTTDAIAAVAATLGPSVVQIETDAGLGSGVVYDDGLVLTNNHVIENASEIRVRTSDGVTFDADLVGADARNDIAVLSVGPGSGLPLAELATDVELVVGQTAVAIGSPFQLSQTVTAGIVSAVNRPVVNQVGSFNAMIQTDAPINPGNSGGALADSAGRVIGINTSIRTDGTSNGNLGIGFAVPIDTAVGVAERITSGASLEPGVLGVVSANEPDNEVGVVIGEVVPGGAADRAGLVEGDRVVAIDGAPVTDFGEVVGLVQSNFAGASIEIDVLRNGERVSIVATLD